MTLPSLTFSGSGFGCVVLDDEMRMGGMRGKAWMGFSGLVFNDIYPDTSLLP
jgi:hypothetical protein